MATKSYNRMIIDAFISKDAIGSDSSISINEVSVPFPDNERKYFLDSFIVDGYIIIRDDGKLWFNKKKWDRAVTSITRKYLLILVGPIVITTIIVLIMNKLLGR